MQAPLVVVEGCNGKRLVPRPSISLRMFTTPSIRHQRGVSVVKYCTVLAWNKEAPDISGGMNINKSRVCVVQCNKYLLCRRI
jgi:hypothetical protein